MASMPVSAAAPEENARSSRNAPARPTRPSSKPSAGTMLKAAEGAWPSCPVSGLEDADGRHPQDGGHEDVGRHGEHAAGLLDAAQVDQGQDDDADRRDGGLLAVQGRHGGGQVGRRRGHRYGDRQHVVHEQRRRDGDPGVLAEVLVGDLVVAAAGGVGVDVLAVGRDDGQQHHHDGQPHPGRKCHRADAGEGQRQQDFIRRVGHGGQRIRGEDGKGDPLRQQGVGQTVVPEGPAYQHPLHGIENCQHQTKLV